MTRGESSLRRVLTGSQHDGEENRRRIILGLTVLVIVPALIGFAIGKLLAGFVIEGSALLLLAIVLVAGICLLRALKNGVIVFRTICALMGLIVLYYFGWSGEDYTFLWTYPFPLAVLFLLGRKEGLVWVVVVLAIVAGVLLLPSLPQANTYDAPLAIRLAASLLIVAILSYGFESMRESDYQRLASEHAELLTSEAKVKTLSGLLPICANCKKIRDDEGYWRQVEVYVGRHTDVSFSHAICPDCAETLYGMTRERFNEIERKDSIQKGEDFSKET